MALSIHLDKLISLPGGIAKMAAKLAVTRLSCIRGIVSIQSIALLACLRQMISMSECLSASIKID